MKFELDGKVALVTGGARDVGREIASVVVNYHGSKAGAESVVAEIKEKGGQALAIGCDISDRKAVDAMVAQTVAQFGGLNILVNNAGLVIRKRFVDTTPEEWRRQIDVCLYGTLNCTHAALPYLEAQKGSGRIISIMGDSSRVGEACHRRRGARGKHRPDEIDRARDACRDHSQCHCPRANRDRARPRFHRGKP